MIEIIFQNVCKFYAKFEPNKTFQNIYDICKGRQVLKDI